MADYTPNAAAQKVLFALARYQYLTADQATAAIGFSPNTKPKVWVALKALTDHRYAFKDELPDKGFGQKLGVWSLLTRGRAYLADRGIETLPRVKHAPDREELFLRHIIAVNDVLIACERFAASDEHVETHSLLSDLFLKREPIVVPVNGRHVKLVGDGWIEMTAYKRRYNFWLEVDRGMEDGTRWKEKVRALIRYAESLGARSIPLTYLVVAPAHDRRRYHLDALIRWTEEVLVDLKRQEGADLFRFTDQMPEGYASLFFDYPHFRRPFDPDPYQLIAMPSSHLLQEEIP